MPSRTHGGGHGRNYTQQWPQDMYLASDESGGYQPSQQTHYHAGSYQPSPNTFKPSSEQDIPLYVHRGYSNISNKIPRPDLTRSPVPNSYDDIIENAGFIDDEDEDGIHGNSTMYGPNEYTMLGLTESPRKDAYISFTGGQQFGGPYKTDQALNDTYGGDVKNKLVWSGSGQNTPDVHNRRYINSGSYNSRDRTYKQAKNSRRQRNDHKRREKSKRKNPTGFDNTSEVFMPLPNILPKKIKRPRTSEFYSERYRSTKKRQRTCLKIGVLTLVLVLAGAGIGIYFGVVKSLLDKNRSSNSKQQQSDMSTTHTTPRTSTHLVYSSDFPSTTSIMISTTMFSSVLETTNHPSTSNVLGNPVTSHSTASNVKATASPTIVTTSTSASSSSSTVSATPDVGNAVTTSSAMTPSSGNIEMSRVSTTMTISNTLTISSNDNAIISYDASGEMPSISSMVTSSISSSSSFTSSTIFPSSSTSTSISLSSISSISASSPSTSTSNMSSSSSPTFSITSISSSSSSTPVTMSSIGTTPTTISSESNTATQTSIEEGTEFSLKTEAIAASLTIKSTIVSTTAVLEVTSTEVQFISSEEDEATTSFTQSAQTTELQDSSATSTDITATASS